MEYMDAHPQEQFSLYASNVVAPSNNEIHYYLLHFIVPIHYTQISEHIDHRKVRQVNMKMGSKEK